MNGKLLRSLMLLAFGILLLPISCMKEEGENLEIMPLKSSSSTFKEEIINDIHSSQKIVVDTLLLPICSTRFVEDDEEEE